jgi:hypothetical protein
MFIRYYFRLDLGYHFPEFLHIAWGLPVLQRGITGIDTPIHQYKLTIHQDSDVISARCRRSEE